MDIVTAVVGVFSELGEWFVAMIPQILGIFWNVESGLTIIGTLAVMSLGIAVTLLVFNYIRDFFRFR